MFQQLKATIRAWHLTIKWGLYKFSKAQEIGKIDSILLLEMKSDLLREIAKAVRQNDLKREYALRGKLELIETLCQPSEGNE